MCTLSFTVNKYERKWKIKFYEQLKSFKNQPVTLFLDDIITRSIYKTFFHIIKRDYFNK